MNRSEFRKRGTIKLSGRDYLQVAYRVVEFRRDNPTATILTETRKIDDELFAFATVANDGVVLATAHKMVKRGGKGPAAQFPLETAETGAIGRALALCGYGTLGGDLDEGDQIADAPVAARQEVADDPAEDEAIAKVIAAINKCVSMEELLDYKKNAVSPLADELRDAGKKKLRQKLVDAFFKREDALKNG